LRAGWDSEPLPTGVVTFLATDVVGSTRLWQELPDTAPGLLAEHLLVVDRAVERHGGRRIGNTLQGDSTMSVFHRAGDAVQAGIGLQRALAGGRVQIHCAAHTGEATVVEDDFAGPTLSAVARIRALGDAGQVLLSSITARLATPDLPPEVRLVDLGPHRLEGFDQPETVLAVDAPGLAVPPDPAHAPYRGLVPYDVDDDESYFGRDREVDSCLQRLTASALLAVVGPSGCGKSSLVRAGIASRLRRTGRSVVVFGPGADPCAALATAQRAAGATTVLVVDQLEELFAPEVTADVADQFLNDLVARLEAAPVVVALRGDHVGSVSSHPSFARHVEGGLHLVSPMTEDELRDVIERPAHLAGLRLEPGLVEVLLSDIRGEPGGLPLLSFALAETWANRDGRVLTVAGYLATGGLRQAIATSAERLYDALPEHQRTMAKALFLRLVTPAPDGEAIRQRIQPDSIITDDEQRRVVDVFVRSRLVMAGNDGLEVAHDALVREWPRLRTWLDDDIEGQRILRHLAVTAESWEGLGRPESELYRGVRLAQADEWRTRTEPDLTAVERTFLDTSVSRERAEVDAQAQRMRYQARQNRRLRVLLAAAAVLLVAVILAGLFAVRQRNRADTAARDARVQADRATASADNAEQQADRADEQAARAEAVGTLAEARRLGTQALVVDDYDQALLLAVEGRQLEDSRETRSNLLATIQRSPDATAVIRSESEAFVDLGFTPDGKTLVASSVPAEPGLSKYDVTTRSRTASIPGAGNRTSSAVSPDGRLAVMSALTGNSDGNPIFELHLVDMATFTVVGRPLPGLMDWPTRLSFSPDGRYIAAVTDHDLTGAGFIPAVALVWDVAKGGEPVVQYLFSAENFQRDVAFLPDSKQILVAGNGDTAIVDIASGAKVGQVDGAHFPIAISPDGNTLAAGLDDKGVTVGLFDLPSRQQRATLAGHRERVIRLAFSADGTIVASGSDDRLVMVWDVANGSRRAVYTGHAAGVNALAFSRDGKTLWSAGDDRAIFVWDLQRASTLVRQLPAVASGPPLPFTSQGMVIDPGGRHVVFPAVDWAPFQIRELATGALSQPKTVEDGYFMSFSPDARRYVTIADDGRLRVWDRKSGALLAASEAGGRQFVGFHEGTAVFTPDGRGIVALQVEPSRPDDLDVDLVVLDAMTLAPLGGEPVPVGSTPRMLGVTPDGRTAVAVVSSTTHPDTKVLLVDLESRRIVRSTPVEPGGQPFGGARNNAVAPDGRTVGVGGPFGDVVVVDAVNGTVSPLLRGHDGRVESITFAPDKATFVTTGQDGAVKLWDTEHHLLGSVLPLGPNHRVRASFVADGRLLITYDTGEVFEWDPQPDAWEIYACTVAGRNLTKAEWAELFPEQSYRVTCPDFPSGQ
jgi:WD40 repeat protein